MSDDYIPLIRSKHGIQSLALEEEPILYLPRLANHHKDPFDRILICQGIVHGMTILTPDESIRQYPVRTQW